MSNILQDQFITSNKMHKLSLTHNSQSELRHSRAALSRSQLTSSHHSQFKDRTRQYQEVITSLFEKINTSVDKMAGQQQKRFEHYEWDLITIVKEEIKQVAGKMRQLINDLQEKIAEKQGDVEIQKLKNELDFFKIQALNLFQTNKALRQEIKSLTHIIQQSKNEKQITNLILRKLKKKQIKGSTNKHQVFQQKIPSTIDLISMEDRAYKFRKIKERINTEPAQNLQNQEILAINEKPTTLDFVQEKKHANRQLFSDSCLNSKSLELTNRYSLFSNKRQSKWRGSREKTDAVIQKQDKGIQSQFDSQAINLKRRADDPCSSHSLKNKQRGDVKLQASLSDKSKWQVNLGRNMIEMNKVFSKNTLQNHEKEKTMNKSRT